MNQDQIYNTIQKLVVAGGGYAVARGIGDNQLWLTISGAVAAIVTWYISHKWNATPAQSSALTQNPQKP